MIDISTYIIAIQASFRISVGAFSQTLIYFLPETYRTSIEFEPMFR